MKNGWVKLPIEPADAWYRLPAFTRALGVELYRLYQDGLIQVPIAQVEDVIVLRMAPHKRERKALRAAVRSIIAEGLIVEAVGGCRLLYSRESYAAYGGRKTDEHGTDQAPTPDVKGTDTARTVVASGTDTGRMGAPKTAESLTTENQIDREKERKEEEERAHDGCVNEPRIERDPEEPEADAPAGNSLADAMRGRKWFTAVFGRDDWDHQGKWRRPLAEIARKPADERAQVGATLASDPWVQANRKLVTPAHVLDYWPKYRDGVAAVPVEQPEVVPKRVQEMRDELAKLEADMRAVDSDSWEHVELGNKHGELLMNLRRAEARA